MIDRPEARRFREAAADGASGAPNGKPAQSSATVLSPDEVNAIATARHGDPFAVLGPHETAHGVWEIRAMLPHVSRALVISADGKKPLGAMERVHPAGLYVARLTVADRSVVVKVLRR